MPQLEHARIQNFYFGGGWGWSKGKLCLQRMIQGLISVILLCKLNNWRLNFPGKGGVFRKPPTPSLFLQIRAWLEEKNIDRLNRLTSCLPLSDIWLKLHQWFCLFVSVCFNCQTYSSWTWIHRWNRIFWNTKLWMLM